MRFSTAFLALTLVAGCALPARDNPDDPKVKPVAVLQLLTGPANFDPTQPEGSQYTCTSSDSFDPEYTGRGRCIFLSAGLSSDDGDVDRIASYQFDSDYTGDPELCDD